MQVMQTNGIRFWNQVDRQALDVYVSWLEDNDYAYTGQYFQMTVLKQCLKFLIEVKALSAEGQFLYPLMIPSTDTTTYCYTGTEVGAMIKHCNATQSLQWLANVIVGLAFTGLRISELASLEWKDVDFEKDLILLPDHSRSGTRDERLAGRRTKGHRSRKIAMHDELRATLEAIPRHPDGRVFHGPNGGRLKPDTLRVMFIRDVLTPLAAKFPPVSSNAKSLCDGRLHSFRHYFCSACANAGVPEQVLMEWLGHRSAEMVRRYYHGDVARWKGMIASVEFTAEQ